jgi:acyl carrier protein
MGLDSVELLLAIEEEFGLDIPDREAEKLVTVGNTYTYLLGRLSTHL